jgi:hypothetical protein
MFSRRCVKFKESSGMYYLTTWQYFPEDSLNFIVATCFDMCVTSRPQTVFILIERKQWSRSVSLPQRRRTHRLCENILYIIIIYIATVHT